MLFCTGVASLEHVLFECKLVRILRTNIVNNNRDLFTNWTWSHWVFGCTRKTTNILVWVINFAIYKAFLQASSGMKPELNLLIKSTLARYEIISWMKWYSAHLDMAYTWYEACGQCFMEYQSHLTAWKSCWHYWPLMFQSM